MSASHPEALYGLTTSRDCKTRFYNNYKVSKASNPNSTRKYYSSALPEYIEVGDHTYVDKHFCEWTRMELAANWSDTFHHFSFHKCDILTNENSASATNVALIYERTISRRSDTRATGGELTGTCVLDSFFLYALLLEGEERSIALEVPHQVQHVHRLLRLMNKRNETTATKGLQHWLHTCSGCFKVVEEADTGNRCG